MKVKVYYPKVVCSEVEVDDKFSALGDEVEWSREADLAHSRLLDQFVKVVSEQIDEIHELDDFCYVYDSNNKLLVEV